MNKNKNKCSPNKKKNLSLLSTSLIFDENIDKLWLYLRDLSSEAKNIDYLDNYKLIKGKNTWTPGNIFSFYWIGVSNIEIKCISSSVTRMKKKITWKLKCDIGISYYKTMILYRITYDDKTLVKVNLTRCEENELIDFNPQMEYYLNLQNKILTHQSNYLLSEKKNKKIYQSSIIDKNYKIIWDYCIDLKHISKICPELVNNLEYKGPRNKKGTFIKFYQSIIKKTIFLKIAEYINSVKRKYFKCILEFIGTEITEFPLSIEIQVYYIDSNKTFIGVLYNFSNCSNAEVINNNEFNLKKIINKNIDYMNDHFDIFNDT